MQHYFRILLVLTLLLPSWAARSQAPDSSYFLLADFKVQLEASQALNDLYNYNFEAAEEQFKKLRTLYKWHPLPYFLMGLSTWWRIMPNLRDTQYDDRFLAYMDSTIMRAEKLYERPANKIEASFFLAAAYGFKGRLYSDEERKNWRKAAVVGKSALNYLEVSKGNHDLNPELMFGDGLYNYFSIWIPENYPMLKPILLFFPKGDKQLGLQQLRTVSQEAFYTRVEAQVFLMRILASYENDRRGAFNITKYLNETFPNNPFFHRYHARMLYSTGRFFELEPVALSILERFGAGWQGYEETSARYAAFFLGQVYSSRGDKENAEKYYLQAKQYAEHIKATDTGYYHYTLYYLGKINQDANKKSEAREYYKQVISLTKKKDEVNQLAREDLKKLKK
jgi:hypothetical protein